ncbi:hypothetical protein MNV49_005542 [Pseudohyphozyma bogoriensis]|nr:hypothetical protein MNV49_005542 [Pseudohyphozyma bogoriensis]
MPPPPPISDGEDDIVDSPRTSGRKRRKPKRAEDDDDGVHSADPPSRPSSSSAAAAPSKPSLNQPASLTEANLAGAAVLRGLGLTSAKGKGKKKEKERDPKERPGSDVPLLLAPSYTLNPAGPASSATTSFSCGQPGCAKVYKGKHARSIWRRHLQDKHGILLKDQPRRSRWDNDANRPKSEEERRARTLDSKRRWARKNRAERSGTNGSLDGEEGDEYYDEDDGEEGWVDEKSASPAPPEEKPAPRAKPKPRRAPTKEVVPKLEPEPEPLRAESEQEEEEDESFDDDLSQSPGSDRHLRLPRATNGGASLARPSTNYARAYNFQPHVSARSPTHMYPPPPASFHYQRSPQGSRAPSAPPEAKFYAGSPVSTSLSTVAGRAALVQSSPYARVPYHPPSRPTLPESNEDAAAVLMALKRASSPVSPVVPPPPDHYERGGDTSLESGETSFGFSNHDPDVTSPPSDEEGPIKEEEEVHQLQIRALKRVPTLSSVVEESARRHAFEHSTSIVRTPTRRTGSAQGFSAVRGGDDEDDEDDEDDDGRKRAYGRSRKRARDDDEEEMLDHSSSAARPRQTGLSSELRGFGLGSPHRRNHHGHGEMLPPHPSSSTSTHFNMLSTPVNPSTRNFFPSSAIASDFYSSAQQPHTTRYAPQGLSSPPAAGLLFSSPAHPGFSKTLGLTAAPGPGVLSVVEATPGRSVEGSDEERRWDAGKDGESDESQTPPEGGEGGQGPTTTGARVVVLEQESEVRNAGKFGKAKRGGGRHFSRDLSRLDDRSGKPSDSDEDSSEEESEEESDEEVAQAGELPPIADDSGDEEQEEELVANLGSTSITTGAAAEGRNFGNTTEVTRGERLTAEQVAEARKAKKAGKKGQKVENASDGDSDLENANKTKGKSVKLSDLGGQAMNRRDREAAEKKAAKERYDRLHAAGKARCRPSLFADLGRLAEIRKQRELAAARRKAEAEAKETANKAALEKSGKKVPGRK